MGFWKKSPLTEVSLIAAGHEATADIVFIHGLGGDSRDTWSFGASANWATWVQEVDAAVNIWSLSYRLSPSNWFGGAMPLTDRAINVLATINADLRGQRPIIFVCHSYGGLLVKQMLRSARDIAPEYRPLMDRVAGIVLIGTPNSGAFVANYLEAMRRVARSSTAIKELKYNNVQLRDLNKWFSMNINTNLIIVKCFFETMPTFGVRVVDETSADINIKGVTAIGIDADHIGICKPPRPDIRVAAILDILQKVRQPVVQAIRTPLQRVLAADNDSLRSVMRSLKSQADVDPNDTDIRYALDYGRQMIQEKRMRYNRLDYGDRFQADSNISISMSRTFMFILIMLIMLFIIGYFGAKLVHRIF